MLYEFLASNRDELIQQCRLKVGKRPAPKATDLELEHGIPLFLEQLIRALRLEQKGHTSQSHQVSGPDPGMTPKPSEIADSAARHGRELLQHGFVVDQVVHDYGDLCQAITELAVERGAPIAVEEFRTLNLCLDNAIAGAVTEFATQRDLLIEEKSSQVLSERLGFLAHELRNLIHTATLAVSAIKGGNVGLAGATGAVLDRSLIGLRNLIDRSLADVRVTAGMPARYEKISLPDFVKEVQVSATLEAQARECRFSVADVAPGIAVNADRQMLLSGVGNLLQNAFKFSEHHGAVSLSVHTAADRVLIDVQDSCGGLHGDPEELFKPFTQAGADRSGIGLGLSICRRSIEAIGGKLRVRNLPGSGCVFTIDLPRLVSTVLSQPAGSVALS